VLHWQVETAVDEVQADQDVPVHPIPVGGPPAHGHEAVNVVHGEHYNPAALGVYPCEQARHVIVGVANEKL